MNRWCPENNDLKRKREDDEDVFKDSKKARFLRADDNSNTNTLDFNQYTINSHQLNK
jgi:hypothetical protein